jgi:hypothetical protein
MIRIDRGTTLQTSFQSNEINSASVVIVFHGVLLPIAASVSLS